MSARGHAALAAACALSIAACGGSDKPKPAVKPASQATIRAADCNLWHVLKPGERASLLAGLHVFFGAAVDNDQGRGAILADDKATAVIDGACRPSYAGAFKLYKIYGRAAAFTPQAAQAPASP